MDLCVSFTQENLNPDVVWISITREMSNHDCTNTIYFTTDRINHWLKQQSLAEHKYVLTGRFCFERNCFVFSLPHWPLRGRPAHNNGVTNRAWPDELLSLATASILQRWHTSHFCFNRCHSRPAYSRSLSWKPFVIVALWSRLACAEIISNLDILSTYYARSP